MDFSFTYEELLAKQEWQEKREQILRRDNLICQKCQNQSYEIDDMYGPHWHFGDDSGMVIFRNFRGDNFQIYGSDFRSKIPLVKNIMLYLSQHRIDGTGKQNNGYFVAAAMELTFDESSCYFPELPQYIQMIEVAGRDTEDVRESFLKSMNLLRLMLDKLNKRKNDQINILENKKLVGFNLNKLKWIFVKDLHVHHTYYRLDKMPWDYPNESLQTLCRSCHEKVHAEEEIPVLNSLDFKIGNYKPCRRCNGAGWFPEYSHVQDGICFDCRGAKYLSSDFIKKV